ncbi:MAG: flagellar basal-body rod protein FlgF [Bilophila sp.]
MQEAAFSGLFGALSAEHRMDFIANNLANAGTSGYKADQLAFKDTMIQFAHDQIMEPVATVRSKPLFPEPQIAARVRVAVSQTDFSQGGLQFTGNPLDLAISGEGFFRVQSPQGDYLTRNGAFCQTADGQLVTKQGWPVLGEGGPIAIPQGTRNVHLSPEGRVFADGDEVGALQIVSVDDVKALKKVGGNLYRLEEGSQAQEINALPGGAIVNQGFLEAANVNVVTEMVKMIEVNRQFEAYQKVMQTSDTLDRDVTTKVGKTSR